MAVCQLRYDGHHLQMVFMQVSAQQNRLFVMIILLQRLL